MSKPRRKNYIYDRNFIVKSRFHFSCACPPLERIYFIQNYMKKCAMHKSLSLGFCIPILLR